MTLCLNNEQFHLSRSDLPCMIHGRGKSGASFFTMNLVLDLLALGHKVIFYSAFVAAREFLVERVDASKLSIITDDTQFGLDDQLLIPISGGKELFLELLRHKGDDDYIIVVKNVEELEPAIVEKILLHTYIVISGGCGVKEFSNLVKDHPYNTRILFSDIEEFTDENVNLEQYQGYCVGRGTVTVKD